MSYHPVNDVNVCRQGGKSNRRYHRPYMYKEALTNDVLYFRQTTCKTHEDNNETCSLANTTPAPTQPLTTSTWKKMPFHQIYENISLNCYPNNSIVKLFWLFDLLWYDAFAVTYWLVSDRYFTSTLVMSHNNDGTYMLNVLFIYSHINDYQTRNINCLKYFTITSNDDNIWFKHY